MNRIGMLLSRPINVKLVDTAVLTPELILSIVAILISVAAIVIEWVEAKQNIRIGLEADYFSKIYQEYLMKKLPEARRLIRLNNDGKLCDTDSLIDELNNMRRDSLFFKYHDKIFYKNIRSKLQNLEDKLTKKSDVMDGDEYAEFISELNEDLGDIYVTINNKYMGKK